MVNPTLDQINRALDAGDLRGRAPNGRFWRCIRNGATRQSESGFRIPVKLGFRNYSTITERSTFGKPGDGPNFDFIINTMLPGVY